MPSRSEVDALVAAVDAEPDDPAPKLALADALDEDGQEDVAMAIRWHVRHNKWPQGWGPNCWVWWKTGTRRSGGERHELDEDFFEFLRAKYPDVPPASTWLEAMKIFGRNGHEYHD